MVGVAEVESATFCVSCKRSNQLSYTPVKCKVNYERKKIKMQVIFFEAATNSVPARKLLTGTKIFRPGIYEKPTYFSFGNVIVIFNLDFIAFETSF